MKQNSKLLLLAFLGLWCGTTMAQFNYAEALQKSLFFYEAQQSGELPDWNRVSWRADSALGDGSDVGHDLTGGWYDAGDHVKFGFPMAYSVTALAWGAIEYENAYSQSGQLDELKRNLRFVTDYFIKCHTAPNEFYGQLGNGGVDHAFWGSPEVMVMDRPAYKIDAANPGSDLAAETAAALAAVSILFQNDDPAYSATLLQHAEQLYAFADNYRGVYSESISDAAGYYRSFSGYNDELVWGAAWLYRATNNASYLTKAETEYANLGNEGQSDVKAYKWGLAWDDKSYGIYVLMSELTDDAQYKADAERHLDYWTSGYNGETVPYSPGGQAHLTQWGSLRHSSNTAFLAFVYSDKVNISAANKAKYHDFAVEQINYALGDNPINRSFMVGFGNNPAYNPHHRSGHGAWANQLQNRPDNPSHVLYGALVGGPSSPDDQFIDDRGDFIANEVACDYNACFTGALARMYDEFGGTALTNFPVIETPNREEIRSFSKFNSNNASGSTISVMVQNRTAWPARVTDQLSYKYFFDISEAVAQGYTIDDYSVTLNGINTGSTAEIKAWDATSNIYYMDVSLVGEDIAPIGDPAFRRETQINIRVSNGVPYDTSNDWSAQGLNGTTAVESTNIPVYDNGVLVFGSELDGGDTPTASFTASPEQGIAPMDVSFDASGSSDPNGDALTYSWNFGNNQTSTAISPTTTYNTPGVYTVSLTVSDGTNTSTAVTKTITVTDGSPIAVITSDVDSGTVPLEVSFDASSSVDPTGGTLTYSWDLGNGVTATTSSVTTSYTAVGDYTVSLTVTNSSNETATVTKTITVSEVPVLGDCAFGAPTANALPSINTQFTNTHVLGNGPNLDNIDKFTINWDLGNNGLYQFSVNTTNGNPDWYINFPVTQSFNSAEPEVTFANTGFPGLDGTYWATIDNGNFVLVSQTGDYTIYFSNSATAPECGDTSVNTDPVAALTATPQGGDAPLEVSFDASGSTDADGDTLSYSIDYGDGTSGTDAVSTHTYTTAGTYTATVTVDDGNGGTSTASVDVTVTEADVNIDPVAVLTATPQSGDAPLEVSFDASGSTDADDDTLSYSIDYGDGTSGTDAVSTHTYTIAGTYTATVTVDDGNGGTSTASVNITVTAGSVNSAPVAALTATPQGGDAPLEVSFDASGSTDADGDTLSYSIDYGDGTSGTDAVSTHTYAAAGTYTVTVTVDDGNGGTSTASVDVTVDDGDNEEGDCSFGAPTSDALPSINTQFTNTHVLGNGPNLDNIDKFTINWDLGNNGLYQFSVNTTNGNPDWYINFPVSQSFNSAQPEVTFANTGFPGLDGTYWATIDDGNFVLVSQTGDFTIYFSNSATAPDCDGDIPPGNTPPVADISATPISGEVPLDVVFDASGSTDAEDGSTGLTYDWDFTTGDTATGITPSYTFDTVGTYDVQLTVTDTGGLTNQAIIRITVTDDGITPPPPPTPTDNVYIQRFVDMRGEILDPANGYFSADGSPHHSIETLIVEAPDYGHVSTSELYSYWMWLEVMHGRVSGDWQPLSDVWDKTEQFIIPTTADQPTNSFYNPSSPASYASEFPLPSDYPSPLDFNAPVGSDPVSAELASAYGADVYQMHWLIDNDNFYGYGNRGDGTSTPSYINTFQRGEAESVYETIPHPSWEDFSWGGEDGFLPLFIGDNSYASQWRYTSAPDADARAVQAMYWATEYAKEQGTSTSALDLDKAIKMGDYLRIAMFDKYFKPLGVQSASAPGATGKESAHYLMSWYMSWGGATDASAGWAYRIGASHCHFGYQNPVAAYALTQVDELKPQTPTGVEDWTESYKRQLEFYTWLQSAEGGIAGGATNSWNGNYSAYPAGVSTFYDMAYTTNPVYIDPGSGTWFGWQAWSMERVSELYYINNDPLAKNLMDKWIAWVKTEVKLIGDDDFDIPATLSWTGQPDTWNADNPGSNSGLSVTVENYGKDLGIAASTAKALIYYAAATERYGTLDEEARDLAKEILDRMWVTYRDDKGVSSLEARGDFSRIFEQEVYVPDGFSGEMANGDPIVPGVSFLDIRSGYRDDPEFDRLEDAYNTGQDYTQRYHRTWAQIEVALANAEYGYFFPEDTPTVAEKVISKPAKLTVSPNPSSDVINITLTKSNLRKADNYVATNKDVVIRIADLMGTIVRTKHVKNDEHVNAQITVGDLPAGLYIVEVLDKTSNERMISKIVVAK